MNDKAIIEAALYSPNHEDPQLSVGHIRHHQADHTAAKRKIVRETEGLTRIEVDSP